MAVIEEISFHVEVKAKERKGKQRPIEQQFDRTVKLSQSAASTFRTNSRRDDIKAVKCISDRDVNGRLRVKLRRKQVEGKVVFSKEEHHEDIMELVRAVAEMGAVAVFVSNDPGVIVDIPVFVVKKGLLNEMASTRGVEVSLQCDDPLASESWDSDFSLQHPSDNGQVISEMLPTGYAQGCSSVHVRAPTSSSATANSVEEPSSTLVASSEVPLFRNDQTSIDPKAFFASINCEASGTEDLNELGYYGMQQQFKIENEAEQQGKGALDDAMSLVESDNDCDGELDYEGIETDCDRMSVDTFSFGSSDTDTDSETEDIGPHSNRMNLSRRFNADLVVQSIQRGESTLEQIKNRDCVMIVGKTGSGKSTLIQAMAGKKIQMRQLENSSRYYSKGGHEYDSGIEIIAGKKLVYEAIDPLPGFEIGHGKKSQTTSISCFDYDPSKHGHGVSQGDPGASSSPSLSKIMLVDSPGFEDTSGHEADVATSILLSQVAKHCRSLRFVILINYVSLLEDRGGSMRSVLRLIRSFTRDFDKEKQSFMFLFTHCNEIQGVPDTIEGAKKSLEDEIIQTLDDTEDQDTKEILNYIRRSLKKNFPFANVYLPLQTNATDLIRTIQTHLKPAKDPHIANNCGLTQSSRLTLGGELQLRLQELRRNMRGNGLDRRDLPMDDIFASLEIFQYFQQYVSTQDTRDAAQEANHLLEVFSREQMEIVQNIVEKVTGSHHEFGPADINDMMGAISRLQVLQEKYPRYIAYRDMETMVNERLHALQRRLLIGESESFSGIHQDLSKLSLWSSSFPQHVLLYENVKCHLQSLIVNQCNAIDSAGNCLKLPHDQLRVYVQILAVLNSIHEDRMHLSRHGLNTQRASNAYQSALKSFKSNVESLGKETHKIFKSRLDDTSLREIGNLSSTMDYIDGLLVQYPICPMLKRLIEDVRQQLSDDISGYFDAILSETSFDVTEQSESLKEILDQTKLASEIFCGNGANLISKISNIHDTVVDRTKSLLMRRIGEISQVTQDVERNGIKDGIENARMLHDLRCVCWFDFFLPHDSKFVENTCIAFERVFKNRINNVHGEVENILRQIGDESCDSELPAKTLKPLFSELSQISQFTMEMKCEELEMKIEEQGRAKLLGLVTSFTDKYQGCIAEWKNLLLTQDADSSIAQVDLVTGRLERIFRERNTLLGLDTQCDAHLDSFYSSAEDMLLEISSHLERTMQESKKYKKKFRLFKIVHAVAKFSHVSKYLPRMEDLQVEARNTVARDAERIQDLVSQTSEWDEIDSLLDKFQNAKILDDFIWREGTSRIAPLLKLREKKQEEVDNLLDQMIANEDFKGIGAFLSPYAESKDQIKNQQFSKWMEKISSILSEIVGSVRRNLEGDMTSSKCQRIVVDIQRLEHAAKQNIEQYLANTPGGLRLSQEVKEMRLEINTQFQYLLVEFESAIKNLDFEAMGIIKHFIQAHSLLVEEKFIHRKKADRVNILMQDYKKTVAEITTSMDKYIHTLFDDSGDLFRMLSTLKNASQCTSPQLIDLRERYEEVRRSLASGLNEAVTKMSQQLSECECYDDIIDTMCSLDQHLKCAIRDHVDDSQLSFNSEEYLKEWREEKQKIDREMEFDGSDAKDKLWRWKKMMDNLNPSRDIVGKVRCFFSKKTYRFKSDETYRRKVRQIEQMISDRITKGRKALKDGDHTLLDECIKILDLVQENLGEHVSNAGKYSKGLQQSAIERFLDICREAQGFLQSENHIQFEATFGDYRGLILYVPCVIADDKCKKEFSLTNQLAHDALDSDIKKVCKMLDEFAFDTVHNEIIRAREFGNFIADRLTLLKEEIHRCSHIEIVDEWLVKIFNLCYEHYSSGRSLGSMRDFAILELPPSASKSQVEKAFKRLAEKYPDKSGSPSTSLKFRSIAEAKDGLLSIISSADDSELPFGALINDIGISLRKEVRGLLDEQRYDRVERILFVLKDLKSLSTLVNPNLNDIEITNNIHQLVRSHVQQAKTTVDSTWSSRNYKALNDTITDLRMMEEYFKSYGNIFPSSWNDGIVRLVEEEIEALGRRARKLLVTEQSAKQNLDDFRRCFLHMGHVLVELPLFKEATKATMCLVLEECLKYDWGYSYLFEFGLSLQRGEENGSENDNNVAQILVTEFSHFKEVMTMVWNEETSQKPVEDTIQGIKAKRRVSGVDSELSLNRDRLLESHQKFEGEYKKLLGEYISPNANLTILVHKTIALAEKLQPIDVGSGWNENVKSQIPCILAGVFTVFTVLKSGESYNRLESTSRKTSEKLLMKPHNIQVLTLLSLFGCGTSNSKPPGLDSQLMQIRTGEGKSMILGAAAVILTLLGFRVRCVCYSEYLSARDFNLFQDIFDIFSVSNFVNYSKITTLSEDTTAAKGNIRSLTDSLLRGKLREIAVPMRQNSDIFSNKSSVPSSFTAPGRNSVSDNAPHTISQTKKASKPRRSKRTKNKAVHSEFAQKVGPLVGGIIGSKTSKSKVIHSESSRKEILLVDEVDVFFGGDFYGQTYNQVTQFREPEIGIILKHIWIANKRNSRKQRLVDIKALPSYAQLVSKMPQFRALIDSEISLMIDQVRKVDEEPYYLDKENDRIGYKVMDSISFEATYGYRTVFAYMQEAERGNLQYEDETLKRALAMPISCGQFSYAEISPQRILGVSGTLSALSDFEYNILAKYGVETFIDVPSVYGKSNFQFDKAGNGICIDTSKSDYFHSITKKIKELTKQKRAVIVFFENTSRLHEFTSSPFYHKLGRQKKLLVETLSAGEKEFVISKAATAGQITISTAVFGRGTDFFCKDETVQKNGGAHVIQTFLSEEQSEEIQIQGRTARQGKKGSYEMILLASDLEEKFGIAEGMKDEVAKERWYETLCLARDKFRDKCNATIEANLIDATEKDEATHLYFDSLLSRKESEAATRFNGLYKSFKKGQMPSSITLDLALLVDLTGSMAPFAPSVVKMANMMLKGSDSISEKLKSSFPDIDFTLRVGIMGYRDIDDGPQFVERTFGGASHFTTDLDAAINHLESITRSPSGGGDLAEDHLGAIDRSFRWNADDDWISPIKLMLLLTDAPAHGMVPKGSKGVTNADNYSVRHPSGLTAENVVKSLIRNDMNLFFCSFNPDATSTTEQTLSTLYMNHPENTEQREIISIPMLPKQNDKVPAHRLGKPEVLRGHGQHIVFVLDMSGSMSGDWSGVEAAYNQYLQRRRQSQCDSDLISVVQFACSAEVTVDMLPIGQAPATLTFRGGGTYFSPAANSAFHLASRTPCTHTPIVVFMSDGETDHDDSVAAAGEFSQLNHKIRQTHGHDLELHVIAFGGGASTTQLQQIAGSSGSGKLHTSADTVELSNIFVDIASGTSVAAKLEAEIGKRISDAVSDRLSLEYMG